MKKKLKRKVKTAKISDLRNLRGLKIGDTIRIKSPSDYKVTDTIDLKKETINHPLHYGGADNPYETIKVLEATMTKDEVIGFLKGNVFKYNSRAKNKEAELENYKKGAWYQNRLVQFMENN